MTQIVFPPGRIVKGHPMKRTVDKDDNNQPKIMKDGRPQLSTFIRYGIEKITGVDWKQTVWGMKMVVEALAAWPGGETRIPSFSWKVVDGDSTEPNKKMNIPCEQEGYPGHWIILVGGMDPINCFHGDNFNAYQQIQDEKEIKTGDYGQVIVDFKKNTADMSKGHTAGMFMNGKVFSLRQVGKKIISKNEVDAEKAFAGQMGTMPANMILDDGIETTPGNAPPPPTPGNAPPPPTPGNAPPPPTPGNAPPPPATDFTELKVKIADGSIHTVKSLQDAEWPQTAIDALEKV